MNFPLSPDTFPSRAWPSASCLRRARRRCLRTVPTRFAVRAVTRTEHDPSAWGRRPLLTTYRALHVWGRGLFVGGALLAQEPFAFRTVVITGDSSLRVQTPATALPGSRRHYGHCHPLPKRRSRAVTARQSCATRCHRLVRCEGAGQGEKCNHSSLTGFPGWADEMGWLQAAQTGAIQASLRQVG